MSNPNFMFSQIRQNIFRSTSQRLYRNIFQVSVYVVIIVVDCLCFYFCYCCYYHKFDAFIDCFIECCWIKLFAFKILLIWRFVAYSYCALVEWRSLLRLTQRCYCNMLTYTIHYSDNVLTWHSSWTHQSRFPHVSGMKASWKIKIQSRVMTTEFDYQKRILTILLHINFTYLVTCYFISILVRETFSKLMWVIYISVFLISIVIFRTWKWLVRWNVRC